MSTGCALDENRVNIVVKNSPLFFAWVSLKPADQSLPPDTTTQFIIGLSVRMKKKQIILNTVILTRRNAVFQYRIRSCDVWKVRNRVARPLQSVSSLFKLLVGMIWRFHDCVIHVYHDNISDSQIELYLADIIWFADIVCSSSLWIHQTRGTNNVCKSDYALRYHFETWYMHSVGGTTCKFEFLHNWVNLT